MSKLSIIQRRELEPLMIKANRIIKHYEKAADCCGFVMGPDIESDSINFGTICEQCGNKKCARLHQEAMNKAREVGGSYIYTCLKSLIFWTSPFYSGERLAGALFSGGVRKTDENSDKVKALARIMLLCANQISGMSFVQKNVINLTSINEFKIADNVHCADNHDDIDMERTLLACLRRGDNDEGQKILTKLIKTLNQIVKNNFPASQWIQVFQLKAIELAVLLSRAVSDPKNIKNNTALETTEKCLKKIEESNTFEEIAEILSSITEKMSGMIFSFHGVRHFSAIRKAERYIWNHYTRKLSLKEIAKASGLSAPYFSTIFKEEMGENLSNYLNRLRVDKAAAMLTSTDVPISEVARICGFEDQSWFSKIFKNNTGLTPGKYRECGINSDINFPS
ncbi:MAG: helix-turn-helix domain-containing protein [Treponema sp.]|nr:helix-turn-helix domain-containing protein [Treponema sp.]